MAWRLFGAAAHAPKGTLVYMDIGIGAEEKPAGWVVFELFDKKVPRTCRNFLTLLTRDSKSYKGSTFHRAIPGVLVQGGDVLNGDGTGNEAADGGLFQDENYLYQHDTEGILSMANDGPNTNGSQFFVTTQEAPFFDDKYVAFGRVVEGMSTIAKIER